MSQHPSFKRSSFGQAHRGVLKRSERVRRLITEGKWSEETGGYGLPKVKIIRFKVKKEKAEKVVDAQAAPAAPAAGTAPAATAPKTPKASDKAKPSSKK